MRRRMPGLAVLFCLLGACKPECSGRTWLAVALTQETPIEWEYQPDPLYLYLTTTRLDRDLAVRDRTPLRWNGKGQWTLEQVIGEQAFAQVAAPSMPCEEAEDLVLYPARVRFELGTEQQPVLDEAQYPAVEVSLGDEGTSAVVELWEGLKLECALTLDSTYPNTPRRHGDMVTAAAARETDERTHRTRDTSPRAEERSMLLLLAACTGPDLPPPDPTSVYLAFQSRGEGEIEPCG